MSENVEQKATAASSSILGFINGLMSLIVVLLIAIGLVTTTAKWQVAQVEFVGTDEVKVTRSTWWGILSEETVYRTTISGWRATSGGVDRAINQDPVALNF